MRVTTLVWGVKESFRNYVEAAGGSIATDGGAERTPDGAIAFPIAPGSELTREADGAPSGRAAFSGEVRFEAHGGMLSVRLSDLTLDFGASKASLLVADERGSPLELAQLDLDAAATGEDGELVIPAALSMDGYFLLGDHYPPRTPLDPVRLRLTDG